MLLLAIALVVVSVRLASVSSTSPDDGVAMQLTLLLIAL